MACQEACDKNIKPEIDVDMRQKHSKRKQKHFRKKKRDCNVWHNSHAVPQPFGDSSQCNWFWENYYNAVEWQERHQVAYWKSRSIALEYENTLLHQYVQSLVCNDGNPGYLTMHKHVAKVPTSCSVSSPKEKIWNMNGQQQGKPKPSSSEEQHKRDSSNQDEFEFQVTEEMMDFFEQSIRHKMELKVLTASMITLLMEAVSTSETLVSIYRTTWCNIPEDQDLQRKKIEKQREAERKIAEKEKGFDHSRLPPRKQFGLQRTQEMKLMYGEAAPMILGMETAMQLGFDRNCDLRQPKLWPNIPLKL